jgi:glycosyltransferase involved in cell wall biosynthesis
VILALFEAYSMSNPQISVVIPTYNRGALIEKTVASVLAQDLPPEEVEVLIVDDGSTDDTWDVLQQLYGENPRIRLFHLENGGVARARNFGLQEARGEFIAYLDHDDLWLPQKLRLQRDKMQKNPRVGLVYCNWLAVDEENQPMPKILQLTQHAWWRPKQGQAFPWILMPHPLEFLRNPISSMSFPLLRTQIVRDLGGFDPQTVPSDDWDLWIRLAKISRFAYVPRVLAHYVHHSGQQHMDLAKAYQSWLAICAKHPVSARKHLFLWAKQQWFKRYCYALLHYTDAKEALFDGKYLSVLLHFVQAVLIRPDVIIYRRWIYLFLRAARRNTERF